VKLLRLKHKNSKRKAKARQEIEPMTREHRSIRPTIHLVWLALISTLLPSIAQAQTEPRTPPISGIAHVAIRVHDLTASVTFYEKLGF
jgi:hypothetical protein